MKITIEYSYNGSEWFAQAKIGENWVTGLGNSKEEAKERLIQKVKTIKSTVIPEREEVEI